MPGDIVCASAARLSRGAFTGCLGGWISYCRAKGKSLPVSYVGSDPLPDTFVDKSQALVEGSLAKNGSFVAEQVQAKCASKYEAAPTAGPPAKSADKGSGSAQRWKYDVTNWSTAPRASAHERCRGKAGLKWMYLAHLHFCWPSFVPYTRL